MRSFIGKSKNEITKKRNNEIIKMTKYITLDDLETYKLARKLSKIMWRIYQKLNWEEKKTMGNQSLQSTDSVGANIAEGYGRFHYLDKIKFYYNSRGSLLESRHWLELLYERRLVGETERGLYLNTYQRLRMVLGKLISGTLKAKEKNQKDKIAK